MSFKPKIFKKKPRGLKINKNIEAYKTAAEELFFINYPQFKKNTPECELPLKKFLFQTPPSEIWIFYPKSQTLVHSVTEKDFFNLRTARNKNIISQPEQLKYRSIAIGVAGLSVGSNILKALVISGGPKRIKIADFDTLEISNLNRIQGRLVDIGQNKAHLAAEQVWDIDPFAELKIYDKGLNKKNITEFILQKPKLDVFIDEMDSLDLKAEARLICKKNSIPVVMATDNGDSVILDVERYDENKNYQIFHGLIGNLDPKELSELDYKTWLKLSTKIVDPHFLTEKMQDSLLEIGKTISAVPQLGTTAGIAGAAISFVIRKISNKEKMPSGRYLFGLEEKLIPNFHSRAAKTARAKKTKLFKSNFGK